MGFTKEAHAESMLNQLKRLDIRYINQGLMKYGLKLSTKLSGLQYSTLSGVFYYAQDCEAEEYAQTMRQGHGVGCYCNYCCM